MGVFVFTNTLGGLTLGGLTLGGLDVGFWGGVFLGKADFDFGTDFAGVGVLLVFVEEAIVFWVLDLDGVEADAFLLVLSLWLLFCGVLEVFFVNVFFVNATETRERALSFVVFLTGFFWAEAFWAEAGRGDITHSSPSEEPKFVFSSW